MKTVLLFCALLTAPALAQNAREPRLEPQIVQACRMDLHLYCADARLAKECLVSRWTKLTENCQGALVMPIHEGEGARDQFGVPAKD
jgi:hypothetical protein